MEVGRVKRQDILEIELARLGNGLVRERGRSPVAQVGLELFSLAFSTAKSLDLQAPHAEGCFLICLFFLGCVCVFGYFAFVLK